MFSWHCGTGQCPVVVPGYFQLHTIDTRGSAWQHPFVGSHCVPGIRNRGLNVQNGFQRHLEVAPSTGFGQTVQDIKLL